MSDLSPVHTARTIPDKIWAKRDDLACDGIGAKGRQFTAMVAAQEDGLRFCVGCAATSAMQLYIGAMATKLHREATVFVPARKAKTPENKWAEAHGVDVQYVRPGYMSCVRKAARDFAREAGGAVKWIPDISLNDTAAQVANLPPGTKRVVVAMGSGACVTGVLYGLLQRGREVPVLGVQVSGMSDEALVRTQLKNLGYPIPDGMFTVQAPTTKYDKPAKYVTWSGILLDPYYAAKAAAYADHYGDLLWITGRRPTSLFVEAGT